MYEFFTNFVTKISIMKNKLERIILAFLLVGMTCVLTAQEEIVVTVNGVSFTMKYVEGDKFVMGA